MVIATRKDAEAFMKPFVLTTSPTVDDFVLMRTGKSVEDFASRLEAYNVAGVTGKFTSAHYIYIRLINYITGVVNGYVATTLKLKADTSALILHCLRT